MRNLRSWAPIAVLALLAGWQFLQLSGANRGAQPLGPAPYLRASVGDTVPALRGHTGDLALTSEEDRWTAVVSFSSTCGHCLNLAPSLTEWFQGEDEVDIAVVTSDTPEVAATYAEDYGWSVPLLSLVTSDSTRSEGFFLSRTPWLFLFDPQGVLRHHGHAADHETWRPLVRESSLGDARP